MFFTFTGLTTLHFLTLQTSEKGFPPLPRNTFMALSPPSLRLHLAEYQPIKMFNRNHLESLTCPRALRRQLNSQAHTVRLKKKRVVDAGRFFSIGWIDKIRH